MSKSATFPKEVTDFRKSNGGDHVFVTEGPSLTRQEFAEECDINSLMARYEGHVIGGPGNLAPPVPMYVDWTQQPRSLLDYMTFMDEAEAGFMSLPAAVRKEFDNDAKMFVDFASDPENLPQMQDWGLAPKPAPKQPEAPQAASAASAAPPAPAAAAASQGAPTHGST